MTASAPAIVVGRQRRAARRALRLHMQRGTGLLGRGDQRVGGHVGVRDAGRAGGDRDERLGLRGSACGGFVGRRRGFAAAAPPGPGSPRRRPGRRPRRASTRCAATRRSPCAPGRGRGWTAASCARRRRIRARRSGRRGRRGRRVRRSRPAGFSRAKPIEAVSTYGDRQCGMAMPPGSPVADWASRAIAARDSPSASVVRPAPASRLTSRPITVSLSAPASTSSSDQVGVDDRLRGGAGHGDYFRVGCYELAGVGEIEVIPERRRGRSGRVGAAPSRVARPRRCRRRRPCAAAGAGRPRRRRRARSRPVTRRPRRRCCAGRSAAGWPSSCRSSSTSTAPAAPRVASTAPAPRSIAGGPPTPRARDHLGRQRLPGRAAERR